MVMICDPARGGDTSDTGTRFKVGVAGHLSLAAFHPVPLTWDGDTSGGRCGRKRSLRVTACAAVPPAVSRRGSQTPVREETSVGGWDTAPGVVYEARSIHTAAASSPPNPGQYGFGQRVQCTSRPAV